MEETNVCKACYGKKQYSVYTGYTRSGDFLGEEGGRIDREENKTCPRCNGTGAEPEKVIKREEQKTFENSSKIEFVRGEEVEVSDNLPQEEGFCPEKAKYVCTINHEFPYVVETIGNPAPVAYKHIRKLPKQEAGPKKFFIKKDIELFTTYNHMEGSEGQAIYLFLKTHGMLEE